MTYEEIEAQIREATSSDELNRLWSTLHAAIKSLDSKRESGELTGYYADRLREMRRAERKEEKRRLRQAVPAANLALAAEELEALLHGAETYADKFEPDKEAFWYALRKLRAAAVRAKAAQGERIQSYEQRYLDPEFDPYEDANC